MQDDLRNLVEATVERFGRLDVLVNNAAPTEASAIGIAMVLAVKDDDLSLTTLAAELSEVQRKLDVASAPR